MSLLNWICPRAKYSLVGTSIRMLFIFWLNFLCHSLCDSLLFTLQLSDSEGKISPHLQTTAKTVDKKFIFIPLIYMLLRVWSIGVDIAVFYLPDTKREIYKRNIASAIFIILVVSTISSILPALLLVLHTEIIHK